MYKCTLTAARLVIIMKSHQSLLYHFYLCPYVLFILNATFYVSFSTFSIHIYRVKNTSLLSFSFGGAQ